MDKEQLINRVIEQIKAEVHENDFTAIEGLLDCLTTEQLEAYLPEDYMTEQAKVIVHDLGSDTALTFMGVPPAWAVRYAYAEKHNQMPLLLHLHQLPGDSSLLDTHFPLVRGPRTVACGDFVALEEEE